MTIGILGAGSLAGFVIAGAGGDFLISPRGQSARLSQRPGVRVAPSNQAVVDACERVLVCLPARTGPDILRGLTFRPGQSVLSAMAGTGLAALSQAVAPARAAVTMMPGHANALGVGPVILHPADADWQAFLSRLGPVHVLDTPDAFDLAASFGALSGASIHWLAHLAAWFQSRGLPADLSRRLVAETLRGNAEVFLQSPETPAEIAAGVTTPGGITALVVETLTRQGALQAWNDGLDKVHQRLRG